MLCSNILPVFNPFTCSLLSFFFLLALAQEFDLSPFQIHSTSLLTISLSKSRSPFLKLQPPKATFIYLFIYVFLLWQIYLESDRQ